MFRPIAFNPPTVVINQCVPHKYTRAVSDGCLSISSHLIMCSSQWKYRLFMCMLHHGPLFLQSHILSYIPFNDFITNNPTYVVELPFINKSGLHYSINYVF